MTGPRPASRAQERIKRRLGNVFLLFALMVGGSWLLIGQVTAQTFTVLHSFTATPVNLPFINSDGALPYAKLTLSSNTLYGTAHIGGTSGVGAVFAVNTDGTAFRNLHSFTGSDGASPWAGLTLSGNKLYGTTGSGGSSGIHGTVFALNADGAGFTTLHSFTGGSQGSGPYGGLILSSNTLYGTTYEGGSSANGTVFALNTDGTCFTNLYIFSGSDGAKPTAVLILSGNTLYGTTAFGGPSERGTVFAINTDGTRFMNLHSFTGSDGAVPYAGLTLSGNTLYGTASAGGSSGAFGTVFALNTDGTGFRNLHDFTGNSDGGNSFADLILYGNTLYGTAFNLEGVVFALNTDGTCFTNLHDFSATSGPSVGPLTNSDGAFPNSGLILSGNTLYGTASNGGSSGDGTVFSISFTPRLTLNPSTTNIILTWPTNCAGFDYTSYTLQSTTNIASATSWTINSRATLVINGQYTVSNPISGTHQFFRLSQ